MKKEHVFHLKKCFFQRSSRGSITRGAPITTPTFSITPHEAEEDQNSEEEEKATLARFENETKTKRTNFSTFFLLQIFETGKTAHRL